MVVLNFLINTFLIIGDNLKAEFEKRLVVDKEFGEKFRAITKFWSLNSPKLGGEGKKCVFDFQG